MYLSSSEASRIYQGIGEGYRLQLARSVGFLRVPTSGWQGKKRYQRSPCISWYLCSSLLMRSDSAFFSVSEGGGFVSVSQSWCQDLTFAIICSALWSIGGSTLI